MNQFGTTSPVSKIAAHYSVPWHFVAAVMETQMTERGNPGKWILRSSAQVDSNIEFYMKSRARRIFDFETVLAIHNACHLVICDMIEQAKEARRADSA